MVSFLHQIISNSLRQKVRGSRPSAILFLFPPSQAIGAWIAPNVAYSIEVPAFTTAATAEVQILLLT
jgi:hypothetical protein